MSLRRLLLAVPILVLAIGCGAAAPSGGPTPASPVSLVGTTWKAIAVGSAATVAGREPSLRFEETRVSGGGGCNQLGGNYAYTEGRLMFDQLSITLVGCEGRIGQIEGSFFQVLGSGVTATVDQGGRLLLEGPAGTAILVPVR
jgi:heat shock protein HslJ